MTDILTTIDNAIHDYSVGADAMRWTPEAAEMEAAKAAAIRAIRAPGLTGADVPTLAGWVSEIHLVAADELQQLTAEIEETS